MNRHVNAIAGRLSLRAPQRASLEILDRITEIAPPRKAADLAAELAAIQSEYPTVTDFEREFPSLCFALATGVGKTRLMGAFISYLHLAHGLNNFFVMAPNLTIYNKLITDFTPNTSKYVFKGIAEFAVNSPSIVTGDNYEKSDPTTGTLFGGVSVNIFNISKINSEVRGGKSPKIRRLSEYIGQSYFDYLAGLDDLVLIMDESHRYRASAGVRAINELKPVLGLELTATPFVETSKGPVQFKNVIYDYPLGKAMEDGFVKEPAVVTQKNFDPSSFTPAQLEEIKLKDGIRLHENVKVELETYARQTDQAIVKPFVLVIARDTTHAGQLMQLIQSHEFFEGRYKDKVIQVDSSKTGAEEDAMVERLLRVEHADEPTEIVIHVNMLKEGWDVTNLYTIVPLRAANARTLIEQSIGRGLRLPYGKRTGVMSVDRLNIVAHDKFQEIVDEANRADSVIRLQQVILDPANDFAPMVTVVSNATLLDHIGGHSVHVAGVPVQNPTAQNVFATDAEKKIAQATVEVIKKFENYPTSRSLLDKKVQENLVREVAAIYAPVQGELEGIGEKPDIAAVVAKATALLVDKTIDIPRITVVPKGEVSSGFHSFKLNASAIHYQPVERDILIKHLRTNELETLSSAGADDIETRLEDYLVRALIDHNDISYDHHAGLLYDLAGQMVAHIRGYLSEDDARNVLQYYQRPLAEFIHAQMQNHYWEKVSGYDVAVSKGFTTLRRSAYTAPAGKIAANFRETVTDRNKIGQMLFNGFKNCLYDVQRFHSDTERKLAIILDRDAQKWFRPVAGQFQMYYKLGHEQPEYVPDFVAEASDGNYVIETKARNEMEAADVLAKRDAAVAWCGHATRHAKDNGGKPWRYLLIPHDEVAENITLPGFVSRFACEQLEA
ncbi:MAG: DEAD/DEAH box helicase family protein [Gammaproteobacteria bacterium]|nr:DEAD/DEAH box helicase family protein [Gammaproteobacteria bacterium]